MQHQLPGWPVLFIHMLGQATAIAIINCTMDAIRTLQLKSNGRNSWSKPSTGHNLFCIISHIKKCTDINLDSVLQVIFPLPMVFQKSLYRALLQCAPAHRHSTDEVAQCVGIVADFPDSTECPICEITKDELPRIVSLDGNFRLVRKRSAGPSYAPPLHGSKFFLPSQDLDRFVRNAGEECNVDVST